jgi:hypothetical protein
VLVLGAATALALVGAAAFRFVSVFAQASTKRPVKIHNIKRRDFDILIPPVFRMAERADNTP